MMMRNIYNTLRMIPNLKKTHTYKSVTPSEYVIDMISRCMQSHRNHAIFLNRVEVS